MSVKDRLRHLKGELQLLESPLSHDWGRKMEK
jgi:hypothetical protein